MKINSLSTVLTLLGIQSLANGAKHGGPPPTFLGYPSSHSEELQLKNDSTHNAVNDGVSTLTASPDNFADSGADVSVKWENIKSPSSGDWIAIYCGRETKPSASDYLDWMYVSFASVNGSVTFSNLINMRCNYFFRYYVTGPDGDYISLVESNEISPKGGINKPMHCRVSLGDAESEMQVTWTSFADSQPEQFVRYSRSCTYETTGEWDGIVANASISTTYSAEDMCQNPARTKSQQKYRNVGYFHTVTLSGLSPNSVYCFEFGNPVEGWSDRSQFRTQQPSNADAATTFVVYGDMGVDPSPAATSTALRVASELDHLDFVLHIGDISYARGYGYIWEQFHYLIEPISSRLPYMVSMGNHEYDHLAGGENDPSGAAGEGFHPAWGNYGADSGGECGVPMFHRFKSPTDGNSIFWYSFNYGNVHVIQMSSEHDYTVGSEQYEWIEANLKAVDRSVTPFVVVTSHRPMYNSEQYASDYEVSLHMRAELDPLWDQYDVDAVFAGHYHSYERTCSVFADKCYGDESSSSSTGEKKSGGDHKGAVHITIGSAGASLDNVDWYDVEWHKFGSFEFGYLRVTTTRNEMLLEYVHNTDGSVADSVLLQARY